jgi:hypothetical protein
MKSVTQAVLSIFAFFGVLSPVVAPMARVNGQYDIHLWPKDDALTYHPSELQRHCQNLHVAAGAIFGLSVLLNLACAALAQAAPRRTTTFAAHFTTLIGGALYIAAVGTLIALVKDVKDSLDDVPVPLPDISVKPAAGTYLDGVGVSAAFAGSVLALHSLIIGGRAGYQELN